MAELPVGLAQSSCYDTPVATPSDNPFPYSAEAACAWTAATMAAAALRQHPDWVRPLPGVDPASRAPTLVSDGKMEWIIRAHLLAQYPADGWIGEETGELDGTSGRTWIVDPLDGSRELLRGRNECAIAIALWADGHLRAAILLNPLTGEWDAAIRDADGQARLVDPATGASRPLPARPAPAPQDARVLVSRSETEMGRWRGGPFRTEALGSIAYKIMAVAAGRADATVTDTPKSIWDIAAGCLVAEAAGLTVCAAKGKAMRFDPQRIVHDEGLIVAPGPLAAELTARLRR